MRDKVKLEFENNERGLIVKSLIDLRNSFSIQGESTDFVDGIMVKFSSSLKINLDKYELGIIINALNNYRHKLKDMNKSRSVVNDLLMKIINDNSKKKLLIERARGDNATK